MMKKLFIGIIFLVTVGVLNAQVWNMQNGMDTLDCALGNATLYDSGGSGASYANNQLFIFTLCADDPTQSVAFEFDSASFGGGDYVCVYDGIDVVTSPLLNCYNDVVAVPLNQIVRATTSNLSGCLTFQFYSDNVFTGDFKINLMCLAPCQEIVSSITGASPPINPVDTNYIDVCFNDTLQIFAQGLYTENDLNYHQDDASSNFYWQVGGILDTVQNFNNFLTEEGFYPVTLTIEDSLGCFSTNEHNLVIRYVPRPTFSPVYDSILCYGEVATFFDIVAGANIGGNVIIGDTVRTNGIFSINSAAQYIPDDADGISGNGITTPATYDIDVTGFIPGSIIGAGTDVVEICLDIEHSFAGDIDIVLVAPNGASVYLVDMNPPSGPGSNYGTPNPAISSTLFGVPETYCWAPGAALPAIISGAAYPPMIPPSTPLPPLTLANDYQAFGNWDNFIGSPVNGMWTIQVFDDYGGDDGFIFGAQFAFDSAFIPPPDSFYVYYDALGFWNSDSNIISTDLDTNFIDYHALDPGPQSLIYTTTSNFACTESDTLIFFVDSFAVNATPEDTIVCQGQPVQLNATASGAGASGVLSYNWTPATDLNNSTLYNPIATLTSVPIEYTVGVTNSNNCTFYDTVNINIQQDFEFSAMGDTTICAGDTIQLHAYVGVATTTAWTSNINNNSINDTTLHSPSVYPTSTTTYTVKADSTGCSQYANITVSVSNISAFTFITDATCGNADGAIIILGMGGIGTYQYSIDGGVTFQTLNTFSNLYGGAYDIVISDDSGCDYHDTIVLDGGNIEIDTIILENPTCGGPNNGSINTILTNPLATVTYTLDVGPVVQDTSLFNGLGAGTYSININNGPLCPDIDTIVTLFQFAPVNLNITSFDSVSCYGLTDATVQLSTNLGTLPYQFNVDGGTYQPDSIFTNLSGGNHIFHVMDSNGCIAADTINIYQPFQIIVAPIIDSLDCFGDTDAQVNISTFGGSAPYTYSFDGSAFLGTANFTNIDTGTYILYVQDNESCVDTSQIIITQPDSLVILNINVQDVFCYGGTAGISFDASGGTSPYEYSIDGVPTFTAINSYVVNSGFYSLQVQDSLGCLSAIHLDTVFEPALFELTLDSVYNTSCGDSSGVIFTSVTGGTYPFIYSIDGWATNQDSATFTNLASNIYVIEVSDNNNCTDTIHAQVSNNAQVVLNITSFDSVSCFGLSDATVQLSASLGPTPYQFRVDGGPYQSDSVFINLSGGSHIFNVMDSNGCVSSVSINIYEPTQMLVASFEDSLSCFNIGDGEIYLAASGGSFPYTFSLDGILYQTSPNFIGLSAGTYTAYFQDDNNCTVIMSPVEVYQPDTIAITNVTVQDISCNGDNDGSFIVSVAGGILPYYYNLDGGTNQTSNVLDLLSGGVYMINVTDANNCPTVSVVDSIFEPTIISLVSDSTKNITCFNGSDGFISVLASGGTVGYSYSIDNGTTYQSDNFFDNLIEGNYIIIVKDTNNCTTNISITLTQPSEVVFTNSTDMVSCAGLSDGIVYINSINGGSSPYYTTSLTNGSIVEFTDTISFSGLSAGNYTIVVSDTLGCLSGTSSIQVLEPISLDLSQTSVTDVTCFGDGDGSVSLLAQEGTPLYTFSIDVNGTILNSTSGNSAIFNNLDGGQYQTYLVDVNGCSDSLIIDIFEPIELIIDSMMIYSPVSCFGEDDGSVGVIVSGGNPISFVEPYSYSWTPTGDTDHKIGPLAPGVYTVVVTDANGCTVTSSETIESVLPIIATIIPDSSYVNMGDTVQLNVDVQNSLSSNLQYSWSPTTGLSCTDCENPIVTYYNDITYTVVVTDSTGCTNYNYTESFVGINPTLLFFVPSGFTPNDDGLNDYFQVYGQDIQSVDMMVFNRWGEKIFQGANQFQKWDGSFNGKGQSSGVYTYAIVIKFLNDEIVNKKGTVTLIK